MAYAPDLVASPSRKLVIEIYGEKSSVKDTAKMEFYRANGFTIVTVPNAVADDAEYSKPIFQLLALICGSDHPERLFTPEPG
jgi:very-short-patch-repair endonuclease